MLLPFTPNVPGAPSWCSLLLLLMLLPITLCFQSWCFFLLHFILALCVLGVLLLLFFTLTPSAPGSLAFGVFHSHSWCSYCSLHFWCSLLSLLLLLLLFVFAIGVIHSHSLCSYSLCSYCSSLSFLILMVLLLLVFFALTPSVSCALGVFRFHS
jgi:hypothetical protein